MKLPFPVPDDNKAYRICISCFSDGVKTVRRTDDVEFHCPTCGVINKRRICLDGTTTYWIAPDGTFWHESVGIFLRNLENKFLFFELIAFPYGMTIPAGHVDRGERPDIAAIRELMEEVGVQADVLKHVVTTDIPGDSCSGGSDDHRWHVYLRKNFQNTDITVLEEGKNPVWLTLEEIKNKNLPVPIRHLVEKYDKQLQA